MVKLNDLLCSWLILFSFEFGTLLDEFNIDTITNFNDNMGYAGHVLDMIKKQKHNHELQKYHRV